MIIREEDPWSVFLIKMLTDLFISEVRVKILKLFFAQGAPEFFHIRDLTRRVGTEINAVRRELLRLTKSGLLRREPRGNRVYFRLRREYLFFDELLSMAAKETGFSGRLIENLSLLGNAKIIFVSRLFYLGRISKPTEIDLFLLGKIDLNVLGKIIKEEEGRLGREVNYTVFTEEEFEFRKKRKDVFVASLLVEPRLVIHGNEERYLKFTP